MSSLTLIRRPHSPRRRAGFAWRAGAATTGAAIVLSLCVVPVQAAPGVLGLRGAASAAVARAAQAAPVAKSTVKWRPCPAQGAPTKQCAWVKVPRVYGRPGAGKVKIAIARFPATGTKQQRVGSLLWDAGGPGGASTNMIGMMATRLSQAVRARFDFVAMDPRGIGNSDPALARCEGPWPVLPARDPTPRWKRAQQQSADVLRVANRDCARRALDFVGTMGTNNVARDLNRVRKALGDRKLTFWGTSYGTRIGYVYATMYPGKVRAMVLDGNIDPTGDYAGLPEIGGTSQDSALSFIKGHYPEAYQAVMDPLRQLTSEPVPLPDATRYTRWDWINFAGGFLAFQNIWPVLPRAARVVATAAGTGPEAEAARAELVNWKAQPNSNQGGGFSVVNCLDYADRLTGREQAHIAMDVAQQNPVFGGSLALQYAMGCVGLGVLEPDPIPTIDTASERARVADVPVLIANATHDGSTPMAWAKRMRKAFDRPMIRYRSGQHVVWGAAPSSCVNKPIDLFVIKVKEPKRSRTCPFVPPQPTAASVSSVLPQLG